MTYKTKLEEAAENYSNSKYGNYSDTVINAFAEGSSWTLKYLSEQGGEYKAFDAYIDKTYGTLTLSSGGSKNEEIKLIDHQALLASEAKRVELEAEIKYFPSLAEQRNLHDKIKELQTALKVSEAKLKKAVEQRDGLTNSLLGLDVENIKYQIMSDDAELSQITPESIGGE